jgi:hypothetical protein
MSASQLRQEFEDLIRRDLLGPAGGETEIITETTVRDRYLLGMLGPLKLTESEEEPFEELADSTEDTLEEGTAEPSTPPKRSVSPSTFGLSFCIDVAAESFHATAKWGQYLREHDAEGKPIWQRYPRGSDKTIKISEGELTEWSPDADNPTVVVRGRIRKRANHWSVTVFLSNEQQEGRPRDIYWLFQAGLRVRGQLTRRPGQGHVSTLDQISRMEDRTNEMLYRRELEFARGHGISVDWALSEGSCDRATEVWTTAMPRAVVKNVDQPPVKGLVTDMKDLAESPDGALVDKVRPMVEDYARWIGDLDQRRKTESDLQAYADASQDIVARAGEVLERLRAGIEILETNSDARDAFRFANEAMWRQRIRSVWIEEKKTLPTLSLVDVDVPRNRSWRAFQLAFLLLNFPALTSVHHPDRNAGPFAAADLLWLCNRHTPPPKGSWWSRW